MRRAPAAVAALAGALALALSSCSGSVSGQSPQGEHHTSGQSEQSLTVFAAASLAEPMDDLLDIFAEQHPDVTVQPGVYDGSSTLVTQLTEGADADVLATANTDTMDDLVSAFDERDLQPTLFATNTLVIAVPQGNPKNIEDLDDLHQARFVVCAPQVPCGAAAQELFEASGFDGEAISQEQNVTAAARRVVSGAADAALVYATDVASRQDELDAVVPAKAGQVVNQYPILTLNQNSPAAEEFTDLVLSDQGQEILSGYGFGAP